MLLLDISAIVAGLALIAWGADRFVVGAAGTATRFGISPLVIGLVIVGFATSAPEVLVAVFATLQGNPALGIGNAVGSNIANIALILGVTALIWPLTTGSRVLRREMPVLIVVTALAVGLMANQILGRLDGAVLLAALAATTLLLLRQAQQAQTGNDEPLIAATAAELPSNLTARQALIWLFVGLVVLLASSRLLVWGSVNIAQALGVSDLVIGLTIVAIGTSLPELAASITAALRRHHDLVIGGIIGSNLFNSLAVLGLPALIRPAELPAELLTRDLPVMVLVTLLLFALLFARRRGDAHINRIEGFILLSCFVGYQWWLFHVAGA